MASGSRIDDLGGPIRRIFGDGTVSGMDEGELLQRFATRRDPAALEAIVVRHGPMVLGVCRRVLSNWHASEDAFQATFLVLARRASTIRDPARLGPWLHGVAHRVALRSRAEWARRQVREQTGTEEPELATASSEPDCDRAELRAAVDEEVRKLPGKFRDPIILCYLDGLTHDEAAAHLRCPVGTVRSRLSTGRARLRDRLTRRGVTVPLGVFATVLTAETASAAVSPVLLITTVRASTAFASSIKGATAAGLVSAAVASLAEGVTTTMIVSKLKIVAGLALMGAMTLGVGGAAAQKLGASAEAEAQVKPTPSNVDETPEDQIARLKAQLELTKAQVKAQEVDIQKLKHALESALSNDTIIGGRGTDRRSKNQASSTTSAASATMPGSSTGVGLTETAKESTATGPGQAASNSLTLNRGFLSNTGPSGLTGGRTAMIGSTMVTEPGLATYQTDQFVIVHKPKSDKVASYSTETGQWTSYRIPEGVDVVPTYTGSLVALKYKGESIDQIATFVPGVGQWFPIDLKEPGKNEAMPLMIDGLAIYAIGHHVYGFSVSTRIWDVLDLPEDAKPIVLLRGNRATVEHGDNIYIFSGKTSKWTSFNTRTGQVVEPSKK